jgi:hypothetical protein
MESPAAGGLPPSHVAEFDQTPLAAVRTTCAAAALPPGKHAAAQIANPVARVTNLDIALSCQFDVIKEQHRSLYTPPKLVAAGVSPD